MRGVNMTIVIDITFSQYATLHYTYFCDGYHCLHIIKYSLGNELDIMYIHNNKYITQPRKMNPCWFVWQARPTRLHHIKSMELK